MNDNEPTNLTIEYNGSKLGIFTSDEPVIFGKAGKKMVVANNPENPLNATIDTVLAYLPGKLAYKVVTRAGSYKYCAELPEELRPDEYIPGDFMLHRGFLHVSHAIINSGKTTSLCKNAVAAATAGSKVLYVTLEDTSSSIWSKCAKFIYGTESPTAEQLKKPMFNGTGALRITDMPMHQTVQALEKLIDKQDATVDVLVIDYYLLLSPIQFAIFGEDYRVALCRELTGLAEKYNLAILTVEPVKPL